MPVIGIVGSSEEYWTPKQKPKAKKYIRNLFLWYIQRYKLKLEISMPIGCSGRCKYGGPDIWMEEICDELGLDTIIHPPKKEKWYYYKRRNRKIAKSSTKLYDIEPQVKREPSKKFPLNKATGKVYRRSGGTWTLEYAKDKGKNVELVIIKL